MGFLGKLGGIRPISPTRNAKLRAKKASDTMENIFIVVGDVPREDRKQVRIELFRLQGDEFKISVHHIDVERMVHYADQANQAMAKRQWLIDLYELVCTFDHHRVQDMIKSQLISRHDFQSYKKTGDSPEIEKLDLRIKKAFTSMVDGLDVFRIVAVVFQTGFDKSEIFDYSYSSPTQLQDSCSPAYIFKYRL